MVTTRNATEVEVHRWVTEASSLKHAVGFVPQTIPTSLGNGRPFRFKSYHGSFNIYHQELGCLVLKVYND